MRLKNRVVGTTLVLFVVLAVVLVVAIQLKARALLSQQLSSRGGNLAKTLAVTSNYQVLFGLSANLEEVLETTELDQAVVAVEFFDQKGELIAASPDEHRPSETSDLNPLQIELSGRSVQTRSGEEVLVFSFWITSTAEQARAIEALELSEPEHRACLVCHVGPGIKELEVPVALRSPGIYEQIHPAGLDPRFEGELGALASTPIPVHGAIRLSMRRTQLDEATFTLAWWAVGILFIATMVGLIGTWFAVGRFINPIVEMAEVTTDLAAGKLSRRVALDRADEVGHLGESLNLMAERLEESGKTMLRGHRRINLAVEHIKDEAQALTRRSVEQVGELGSARDAIGSLRSKVESISQSVTTLSSSSENTSSSALELVASMEEVITSAEDLEAQVEETAAATLEMVTAIREVGESIGALHEFVRATTASMGEQEAAMIKVEELASRSRELAAEVLSRGEGGQNAVESSLEANRAIIDAFTEVRGTVERLASSSAQIGSIIEVIDDVALKTNLLALNASILAAQAGEEGRGFAVVASEIRDLAERTGLSTGEVTGLIRSVQSDVEAAHRVTLEGAERIEEGAERSRELAAAFGSILESAASSADLAGSIAETTTVQAGAARDVADEVGKLMEMAEQVFQAIEQQEKGSEHILRAVEEMRRATQQVRRSTEEQGRASVNISKATEDMMTSLHSISEAIGEQTDGARQLAGVIDGVSRRSESNSGTAEALGGLVEDLSADAGELESFMGRLGLDQQLRDGDE